MFALIQCQNAIPNDQQDQPPVNGGQELKCSIQALDELNGKNHIPKLQVF